MSVYTTRSLLGALGVANQHAGEAAAAVRRWGIGKPAGARGGQRRRHPRRCCVRSPSKRNEAVFWHPRRSIGWSRTAPAAWAASSLRAGAASWTTSSSSFGWRATC